MGESAIGIALTLRDLIIILGYDTTQWWGIPFRVAVNFQRMIVSWH